MPRVTQLPAQISLQLSQTVLRSSAEWGKGKKEQPTLHASYPAVFEGNKEKTLTLPLVWEEHRTRLRLSPIAKGPQVQELSDHGELCKPAPLGTWHDSVGGEKKNQQVLALSSRNQVLARGRARRCWGAWSRSGEREAARLPAISLCFFFFFFLSKKGLVYLSVPSLLLKGE